MGSKFFFKICLYGILGALVLFGPVFCTWAGDSPIGKIVALRGRATAFQEGFAPRVLALKSPVYLKETIETDRGKLQIMFMDNTLMTIGRNAKMVLEACMWKAGDPDSKLHTRIKAGSFRVMGGAIARDAPQNFKTQAPSATIGIRGSMYAGLVRGNRLSVVYQGGKGIYVSNPGGRVEIDRPGFGTEVADTGQPPAPPEKFDETRLDEIEGGMASAGEGDGGAEGDIAQAEAGESGGDGMDDPGSDDTANGESDGDEDQITGDDKPPDSQMVSDLSDGASGNDADPTGTILLVPDTVAESLVNSSIETTTQAAIPVAANSQEQEVFDLLAEIGFIGPRATTVPSSGIWIYTGILRDDNPAYSDDILTVHINWHNRRFIGFEKDPNYSHTSVSGFAIGEITETGASQNVRLFGSDNFSENGDIYAFTGQETFGHIYGTSQGALGMTMEGTDYPLNQASSLTPKSWSDTVAATFERVSNSTDPGDDWNGFFIGLAEDMNAIDTGRVCFINDAATDLSISFDRDAGTFSGSMSGDDALGSVAQLSSLQIGGTGGTQSAYVADDLLGGELSGSNVVSNGSGSTDLKPHGNFLVSSMETQLSDNTYWGYWEIAYIEPGTGNDYHVHVPGALWIAGAQTPATRVQWLIDNSPAGTLAYTGRAKGIMIDPTVSPGLEQVSRLTNGTTSLNVDFSNKEITGNINFTQVNLAVNVAVGDFLNTGFTGSITTSGATTDSKVSGVFFGPDAQGLGGNFSAEISAKSYQGIFAGDR